MNNTKSDNVLVTGGGGFLGKAIVKMLVKRGESVCSFSRNYYPELKLLGVRQYQGDISSLKEIEKACINIDTVFHTAAKPGVWGKYSEYYNVNVTGTKNVISACRTNKVKFLVHTSSPSVVFDGRNMEGIDESYPYPDSYNANYPETKAAAEKLVVESADKSLQTVVLRPHLIWGPGDNHLVPRIISRAKRLLKVGNGNNLVDTVYIDNAAYAHILAVDKLKENPSISGNIYFISQDDPILLWEMVNNILKAAHLPPVKRFIPYKMAWMAGALFEFVYKILHLKHEPQITRFVANELSKAHWFDISAAKKDLGYIPKITTKEGLIRLEKWLSTKK